MLPFFTLMDIRVAFQNFHEFSGFALKEVLNSRIDSCKLARDLFSGFSPFHADITLVATLSILSTPRVVCALCNISKTLVFTLRIPSSCKSVKPSALFLTASVIRVPTLPSVSVLNLPSLSILFLNINPIISPRLYNRLCDK